MFRSGNLALLLWVVIIARGLAVAKDQVSGYASLEPALENAEFPEGLTAAKLESLPIGDPKLRIAYMFLVRSVRAGTTADARRPAIVAIQDDLRRRGDSATPLLLDMMDKNRNTNLEHLIPSTAAGMRSIKMEPYLDYLRYMVRTRPDEINYTAYEIIAQLFIGLGNEADIKMIKELAARRPFLAPSLEGVFEMQRMYQTQQTTLPDPSDARRVLPKVPRSMPEKPQRPSDNEAVTAVSTLADVAAEPRPLIWPVWAALAAILAGIAGWLVIRSRKQGRVD